MSLKNFSCEFCGNNLQTLSSLEYHKKNNKKCLEIQNVGLTSLLSCEFCNKKFSKHNLKIHIKSCKEKKKYDDEKKNKDIEILEQKNKELLKENEELKKNRKSNQDLENENNILRNELKIYKCLYEENKNVVMEMAKEPKTKNSKIITNTTNTTFNYFDEPEKVKDLITNNLTIEHIIDGQKGVAEFAYDYLLKDNDGSINYFCSDPSRSIFKYFSKNGVVEKDVKALKLTKLMLNGKIKHQAVNKASELWTNEDGSQNSDKYILYSENAQEIINIGEDNTTFRNHLASLTSK